MADDARQFLIDDVVLLLVRGLSDREVRRKLREEFGVADKGQATRVLQRARRAITIAADYRRDTEIGTAKHRLETLFREASEAGERATALAAQKELDKLLGLYKTTEPTDEAEASGDAGRLAAELAAIGEHLRPLGLGPEGYPLTELARVAAERIREQAGDRRPEAGGPEDGGGGGRDGRAPMANGGDDGPQ